MANDILMNHPDGSGRLIPHALYMALKPKYEERYAAFEGRFGTPEEREANREVIGALSMVQEPVYKTEAAEISPVQPHVVPVSLFGGLPTKA